MDVSVSYIQNFLYTFSWENLQVHQCVVIMSVYLLQSTFGSCTRTGENG